MKYVLHCVQAKFDLLDEVHGHWTVILPEGAIPMSLKEEIVPRYSNDPIYGRVREDHSYYSVWYLLPE